MRKRQDTNNTGDPTLCQALCKGLLYDMAYKYSVSGLPTRRKLGLGDGVDDSRDWSPVQADISSSPDAHAKNPPSLPETKPGGMEAGPPSDFPTLHPTPVLPRPAVSIATSWPLQGLVISLLGKRPSQPHHLRQEAFHDWSLNGGFRGHSMARSPASEPCWSPWLRHTVDSASCQGAAENTPPP